MKPWLFAAFALTLVSRANAGVKVSNWAVGEDRGTHTPQTSLSLTKTRLAGFNLHTFGFSETVWSYSITLRGDLAIYGKDQITISPFVLSQINAPTATVTSGEIRLDAAKHKILIALQVRQGGKIEDFPGNGEYDLPPNAK